MKLGELIDLMKTQRLKTSSGRHRHVVVEGPVWLAPESVESYRGYYEDLAIRLVNGAYNAPTVMDFIAMLESAVGKTFEGYKGGLYRMGRNTNVWFANHGETGSYGPSGIKAVDDDDPWCVTLTYGPVDRW